MFVFFKQKTAYEMRISDWSSDVCSSDLRLCKVRILLVGAPAYFERHGRPRHPRDLAEHRALQYAYSRSGPSWRFRHERHGEFTQSMEPSLRANNAAALTHRSEEHTSELQSLMRISYAVFCLKTKTPSHINIAV